MVAALLPSPGKTKKIEAVKQGGINEKGWDLTALASGDDHLATKEDVQKIQEVTGKTNVKVGGGGHDDSHFLLSLSYLFVSLSHYHIRNLLSRWGRRES